MREGRKSVYLEAQAVDDLKLLIANGYEFHGIRLNNMSQVIMALIKEHQENLRKNQENLEK